MVPNARNVLGASPPATLPDPDGVCVILASAEKGTDNVPAGFFDYNVAYSDFGHGPAVETAAQVQPVAGKRFMIIKLTCSVAAGFSTFATSGSSAVVATAHSGALPLDDFRVVLKSILGGTVGTGPLTYQYSLDNGESWSPTLSLGTAVRIQIAGTGIDVDLTTATWITGDTIKFTTHAARPNDSDLTAALAALKRSSAPWETLFVYMNATHTTVQALDTWLLTLEADGSFQHTAIVNFRPRAQDGSETEAAYAAAFQTEFGSTQTPRVLVCADQAEVPSTLISLPGRSTALRYAAIPVLARGMSVDMSVDPAEQDLGALPNVTISDGDGNPIYHDEQKDPGLDDDRATTLRSFPGFVGAYICNARLLSDPSSRYKWWQHARCTGRARDVSTRRLVSRLSKGVRTDRKTGFILEADAQELDGLINGDLQREFITSNPQRLSDILFTASRTDPDPETQVTGSLQLVFKKYAKGFLVTTTIVETITT